MIGKQKSRDQITLETYLQEIGKEPLLQPSEEIELARRIKNGDRRALNTLVRCNLRFVVSVAKEYRNMGLPLNDLINEGNLGLIKAARRYDETRGFKFISYAVWWVRQQVLQALAEQSRVVRLPLNKIGELNKIKKASEKLENRLTRKPNTAEIADELNAPCETVFKTQQIFGRHLSLDAPVSEDHDNRLLDTIEDRNQLHPDSPLDSDSLRIELGDVLDTLTLREARVLKMYFGIGGEPSRTLEEIGDLMGFTRERARQIKEKALRRMRFASRCTSLRKFLD